MENVYKIHNELKDLLIQKADHRLEGILVKYRPIIYYYFNNYLIKLRLYIIVYI